MTAKLESEDGKEVYASATLDNITSYWSHSKVMLTSNCTDSTAQVTLYIEEEADLAIRLVSLFPAENVQEEELQPFRTDMLQYLKDLQPRLLCCAVLCCAVLCCAVLCSVFPCAANFLPCGALHCAMLAALLCATVLSTVM